MTWPPNQKPQNVLSTPASCPEVPPGKYLQISAIKQSKMMFFRHHDTLPSFVWSDLFSQAMTG
jgi:hypothetical protein